MGRVLALWVWNGVSWNGQLPKCRDGVPILRPQQELSLPTIRPKRKKCDDARQQQKTRLDVGPSKKNTGGGTKKSLAVALRRRNSEGAKRNIDDVPKRSIAVVQRKRNIDDESRNNKLPSNVIGMRNSKLPGITSSNRRNNVDEWQTSKPQNNAVVTRKPCEISNNGPDSSRSINLGLGINSSSSSINNNRVLNNGNRTNSGIRNSTKGPRNLIIHNSTIHKRSSNGRKPLLHSNSSSHMHLLHSNNVGHNRYVICCLSLLMDFISVRLEPYSFSFPFIIFPSAIQVCQNG